MAQRWTESDPLEGLEPGRAAVVTDSTADT